MSTLSPLIESIRSIDLEKMTGLRPAYPSVAVEICHGGLVLVRLKRHRRRRPTLEAHHVLPLPEDLASGATLRTALLSPGEGPGQIRSMFEASGTRPGRLSLVVPDNLAKISLLGLPERPGSRRQLEEIIRFKVRRSVPFRLDEAVLSYEVLPREDSGINVLVALIPRVAVEQYESLVESVGARVGLLDLCTPNLFNLCRREIEVLSKAGDVAVLNCTRGYFSLLIVRRERLIFYRCKSYAMGDEHRQGPNGAVGREMANSLSYYQEKLAGQGIHVALIRSSSASLEETGEMVRRLGIEDVRPIDPTTALELPEGARLDPLLAQRIAPAVGAAVGRGR